MDLLTGKIKPMYFQYLFAASGSAMMASVFGLVDAMMVGRYHGPAGNATLAVFNPLWSIMFSLGLLAGIGGSVLFANARGRGDEENAREYFTASLIYGLLLSLLTTAGIGIFRDPLFRFFGADDELLALAKRYLAPLLFAIPSCVFSNILSAFLRNDGNPGLATRAVIIGGVFNVFGDWFLVFRMDMGISGAGLATAIGQIITTAVMLLHFVSKKNTLRLVSPLRALRRLGSITLTGFSSAITAPLAAAYATNGVLGWGATLKDMKFKTIWIIVLLAGCIMAIALGSSPTTLILVAQAANAILLPIIAFFVVFCANGKDLGKYKNGIFSNVAGVVIIIVTLFICYRNFSSFLTNLQALLGM